jgi:hypothetical protein
MNKNDFGIFKHFLEAMIYRIIVYGGIGILIYLIIKDL